MKSLIYGILSFSGITFFLSIATKYMDMMPRRAGLIAGIGPTGYLTVTIVLLLLCANLSLLELLKKSK